MMANDKKTNRWIVIYMKSIILCEITMIKNSRYLLHTYYIQTSVFFRYLATLTSPAKGVGWGDWREGRSRAPAVRDAARRKPSKQRSPRKPHRRQRRATIAR